MVHDWYRPGPVVRVLAGACLLSSVSSLDGPREGHATGRPALHARLFLTILGCPLIRWATREPCLSEVAVLSYPDPP